MHAGTRPAHTDTNVSADPVDRRTSDTHSNDNADRTADRDCDADIDANVYTHSTNPDAASFADCDADTHAKLGTAHGDRSCPARATGQAWPAAFNAVWRNTASVCPGDRDTHASSLTGKTTDETSGARTGRSGFFRHLTVVPRAYAGYVESSAYLVRQLTWR